MFQDPHVTLTITKLAGLGDGMGIVDNHKIFVAYTLEGETVKARIYRQTKEASYALLEEVLTPSPSRIDPICKHFGTCGGCTMQHMRHAEYIAFKQKTAEEAVRKAGYDPACVETLIEITSGSRRRVELKVENGELGYFTEGSHDLVAIEQCPILEPELEALVSSLSKRKELLKLVTSIQINGVDHGYDILFASPTSHTRDQLCHLTFNAPVLRASLSHDHETHTFFESQPVALTLGSYSIPLAPGVFLQASRKAQQIMIEHVVNYVGGATRILDLFAGIGTYSFPLSKKAHVMAIEIDRTMVDTIRDAASQHKLGNALLAEKRDLFLQPIPSKELNSYDAVILNPPRTGAKTQCEALAKSTVKKVVMVSCNPATFTRDARILKEGGFELARLVPIDQFVYTSHLEFIAEFTK